MKFHNIQALRAIAASGVVLFHAQGLTLKYATDYSPSGRLMGDLGGWGVDVFFVISGFVIYLTTRCDRDWRRFAVHRIRRIVPIYWLLTTLLVALELALPSAFSGALSELPGSYFMSLLFLAFLNKQWPLIFVGWSLEYEMIFYAVTAAMLATGRNIGRILPLCILAIYALALEIGGAGGGATALLSNSILLEFVVGILVARVVLGEKVGLVDLSILAVMIAVVLAFGTEMRLLVRGFASAAVLFVIAAYERRHPYEQPIGFVELLGNASYAIYLVQVFTLPLAGKVFKAVFYTAHPEILVWTSTLFTILVGLLAHRLVEKPMLAWLAYGKRGMRPFWIRAQNS
jgi:exopolysaccharide production protein ExoZ